MGYGNGTRFLFRLCPLLVLSCAPIVWSTTSLSPTLSISNAPTRQPVFPPTPVPSIYSSSHPTLTGNFRALIYDESSFKALFSNRAAESSVTLVIMKDFSVLQDESFIVESGQQIFVTSPTGARITGVSLDITSDDENATVVKVEESLFVVREGGSLHISNVTISANSQDKGGAVWVGKEGQFIATSAKFFGCVATNYGGAIYSLGATKLQNTTFVSSSARRGGAVYSESNSTLTVNASFFRSCEGLGGAIYSAGDTKISSSFFEENKGDGDGGDVYHTGGSADLFVLSSIFTNSYSSDCGGSLSIANGATAKISVAQVLRARAKGGGGFCAKGGAQVFLEHVRFVDTDLTQGQSGGGAIKIQQSGTILNAVDVVMNSTSNNISNTELGGGVFAEEGAFLNATGFTCQGLSASLGACIYGKSGASLHISSLIVSKCLGLEAESPRGVIYITSVSAVIEHATFTSNRHIDGHDTARGVGIYALESTLYLRHSTFDDHIATGSGAGVWLGEKTYFYAQDIVVTRSRATESGGFLYAFASEEVVLEDVTATDCSAYTVDPVLGPTGRGGVLYVEAVKRFYVKNAQMQANTAGLEGGAIYFTRVKEDSPKNLHYGVQLLHSTFQGNNASSGGAILGKQSILYAQFLRAFDNFATVGPSAIDISIDSIFQHSIISTAIETRPNASLVSGVRLVIDNTSLSTNMGAEIAISQDIGSRDEDGRVNGIVYPILSRNSDMSSVRVRGIQTNLEVGFGYGAWDWARCIDTTTGTVERWVLHNDIPDLDDTYGAFFEPVCPESASCVEDVTLRTILCTCASNLFYEDIYNEDNSCLEAQTTIAPVAYPTPTPTYNATANITVLDDENKSWPVVSPNPYGPENILHYFESFDDANETAIILHWTLVALVITMAIITLIVDPGRFHGPDQDEEELNVLRILSLHHILVPVVFFCANRKKYMNILDTEDPNEPVNTGESNVRSGSRKQSSGRRKSSEPKGGDLEHRAFEDINLTPAVKSGSLTGLADLEKAEVKERAFNVSARGKGEEQSIRSPISGANELESKRDRKSKKTKKNKKRKKQKEVNDKYFNGEYEKYADPGARMTTI